MSVEISDFFVTDLLEDEETIKLYLDEVIKDKDKDEISRAISHAYKARLINNIQKDTGVDRDTVTKLIYSGEHLSEKVIPIFLRSFGVASQAKVG